MLLITAKTPPFLINAPGKALVLFTTPLIGTLTEAIFIGGTSTIPLAFTSSESIIWSKLPTMI